jgi:hypothetical protein
MGLLRERERGREGERERGREGERERGREEPIYLCPLLLPQLLLLVLLRDSTQPSLGLGTHCASRTQSLL